MAAALGQLGLALDNREQWLDARQALLAPFESPRVMSATGIARHALGQAPAVMESSDADAEPDVGIDPYLLELLVEQDDDRFDQPDEPFVRRRGRTGSSIGSAVHAVLQLADLAAPAGLDELVRQQCDAHGIPDHTGIVHRLIGAALGSEAVALAAQHNHFKELFVTAPVHGRTIEGYVDLLVETPDGLIIVDYKTDAVRSEEDVDAKLRAYELQAAAYAVALEIVTDTPVIDCQLVFCTASGAIERSIQQLDQVKDRVRLTMQALTAASADAAGR